MIEYTVTVYKDDETTEYQDHGRLIYGLTKARTEWRQHSVLHREGGPAVEWANGTISWYLDGRVVSEDEVMNPPKEMTLQEVANKLGYRIKIID